MADSMEFNLKGDDIPLSQIKKEIQEAGIEVYYNEQHMYELRDIAQNNGLVEDIISMKDFCEWFKKPTT